MKKILTSVALLAAFATGAYAQKNIDLAFKAVKPANDATYPNVVAGDSLDFTVRVVNKGTDAVAPTDTILVWYLGNMVNNTTGNLDWNLNRWTGLNIAAGDSLDLVNWMTKGGGYIDGADTILYWFFDNATMAFTYNEETISYKVEGYGWDASGNIFNDPDITDPADPDNTLTGDNSISILNVTFGDPTSVLNVAGLPKETISVYPNPATNKIGFNYNFATNTTATVNVTDVTGRTVIVKELGKQVVGQKEFTLDVSALSNGMYYMELVTDEKRAVSKFNINK